MPDDQRADDLGIDIEITYAEAGGRKTVRLDPNGLKIAVLTGQLPGPIEPLPDATSICSGRPAVLYRTWEATLALTPDELERLVLHNLTPLEYMAVREHAGEIYDIHDDFYDPDSGIALQASGPGM